MFKYTNGTLLSSYKKWEEIFPQEKIKSIQIQYPSKSIKDGFGVPFFVKIIFKDTIATRQVLGKIILNIKNEKEQQIFFHEHFPYTNSYISILRDTLYMYSTSNADLNDFNSKTRNCHLKVKDYFRKNSKSILHVSSMWSSFYYLQEDKAIVYVLSGEKQTLLSKSFSEYFVIKSERELDTFIRELSLFSR